MHMTAGASLDGVLGGIYADGVQLEAATYIRADDYDVPLDGTQIIPWQSIIWIQELVDAALVASPENATR